MNKFVAWAAAFFALAIAVVAGMIFGGMYPSPLTFKWIEEHGALASWVQAFGSIIALIIAIYVPYSQHRNEQKATRCAAEARSQHLLKAIGDEVDVLWDSFSTREAKKKQAGNKVGLSVVRELADTRNEFGASKAFVVTSTFLTRGAALRIQRDRYQLGKVDRNDLDLWIDRIRCGR